MTAMTVACIALAVALVALAGVVLIMFSEPMRRGTTHKGFGR